MIPNVIAIVYGAAMAINLEWPRIALYIDDTYKWGPIVATIVLVGFGLHLLLRHPAAQGRGARGAPRRGCGGRLICPGWAGDVPAHPAPAFMEDPFRELARRDAKAIRGGMRARVRRPRDRRRRALRRADRRRHRAWSRPRSSRSTSSSRGSPGPRFMAERRPVLAPGVAGGHPIRAGRLRRLRGERGVHRLAPGRGARTIVHRHDDRGPRG